MRYIHSDYLNTPKVVTDENQAVVWKADYQPFGEVTETISTIDMPLRYPGQIADDETGLSYNNYRNYDVGTGRYTQSDPIGLLGGLNTYAYANLNPVNRFDSLGLLSECNECEKSFLDCMANCIRKYDPLNLGGKAALSAAGSPIPKGALRLPRGTGQASQFTTLPSAGAHYATGGRAGAGTAGGFARSAGRAASRLWVAYGIYLFGMEVYCAAACSADQSAY